MTAQRLRAAYSRLARYVHNSLWIVGERVVSLSLSFVTTVFVARYLGPEDFGLLAYALSLVAIFTTAGHMGLSGLIVRDLVKYPAGRAEIVGTTIAIKTVGLGVGYILLVTYAWFFEGAGTTPFLLIVLAGVALIFKSTEVFDFWFQAFVQARYASVARLVSHSVAALFRILLVLSGAGILLFALTPLLQAIVGAVLLLFLFRQKAPLRLSELRATWARARSLFRQGSVIYLAAILGVIYLKVDQVMLRWLADVGEVGQYAVAAQFSEALYFLPAAIVASVFPKLIELRERNEAQFYLRLQQLLDLLFFMSVGFALFFTLASEWLVTTLFGQDYSASANVLVIHVWSSIFVFLRAGVSKWILVENALWFSLVTQGLGALTNVVLNLLLIPSYGGVGAAYATLFSYGVASFLAFGIHRRSRVVFWLMMRTVAAPVRYLISALGGGRAR